MTKNSLLVLNGPGLADLGADGNRYGDLTLERIRVECSALCKELGMRLDFRQTDDQEEMIRWITTESNNFAALIVNPVGYARAEAVDFDKYESALEKVAGIKKLIVEVHIGNIFREGPGLTRPLQRPGGERSFICGLGIQGYLLAIKALAKRLPG